MTVDLPIHQVEEWQSVLLQGETLSDADRRLADSVASGEGPRVEVDELVSGVRIRAQAWVGVLRFERFEVQIVPKLAGDNLGLTRVLQFTSGLQALRRAAGRRPLHAEGRDLFDLIAALFLDDAERLVRAGLCADYIEREDDLPILRGRLLVREQLLRRHALPDRLECRFEERSHDVLDNRILGAAAERLAARVFDGGLRRRSRGLVELLSDVCDWAAFDAVDARLSVVYGRLNDHYSDAHQLAWLIFEDAGIDDVFSHGEVDSFAFLIDMNRLFERFLERLAEVVLGPTWLVERQRRRSIVWDRERRRAYSTIRPDIVVARREHPVHRVTIDAKYKLYNGGNVDAGDVAQSFVYAYAHSATSDALPKAIIVHPSSSGELTTQTLAIRRADALSAAELSIVGIPIPQVLDEVEQGTRGPVVDGFRAVVVAALEHAGVYA